MSGQSGNLAWLWAWIRTVQSALPGNFTAHESMVADARAAVGEAQENLRVQERIYLELVQDALPLGRKVLELHRVKNDSCASTPQSADLKNAYTQNTVSCETQPYKVDYLLRIQDFPEVLILTGPEHLHITGANGSGKTVLLNAIAHANDPDYRSPVPPAYQVLYRLDNTAYLPQRIILDPELTLLETVQRANPGASGSICVTRWRACSSVAKAYISALGIYPEVSASVPRWHRYFWPTRCRSYSYWMSRRITSTFLRWTGWCRRSKHTPAHSLW